MENLTENYEGWDTKNHLQTFDLWNKKSNIEFNFFYGKFAEQKYLLESVRESSNVSVLDVGCATATTFRYLRNKAGGASYEYLGVDLSEPVLEKAKSLYPGINVIQKGNENLLEFVGKKYDIVFSRDTVLHQDKPYEFLQDLLDVTRNKLLLRLRTRDDGETEYDVKNSCQMHYDKFWMPYIVLNFNELISFLKTDKKIRKVTVNREYQVLGGRHFRFLPKELYFRSAGAAETSLMIEFSDEDNSDFEIVNDTNIQGHAFAQSQLIPRIIFAILRKVFK